MKALLIPRSLHRGDTKNLEQDGGQQGFIILNESRLENFDVV